MNAQDAIARALALRAERGIDPAFATAVAEQRIIERVVDEAVDRLPEPGPREDRIAWVITLASGPFSVELAIDDATGALLRVRTSRGAALINARSRGRE